jgi:hypothetical protein
MEDQTNNEPAAGESANNEQTASELFDSALATIDVRDMKARLSSLESETRGVTSRLTTLETEVVALKSTVEDRFKDTRPMWQAINERTERIEARLDRIDETMQMLAGHELELAAVQSRLSSRVTALERENERRTD